MRFLLAKDLRILRRSPLLVSLLVVYPLIIAVNQDMNVSSIDLATAELKEE